MSKFKSAYELVGYSSLFGLLASVMFEIWSRLVNSGSPPPLPAPLVDFFANMFVVSGLGLLVWFVMWFVMWSYDVFVPKLMRKVSKTQFGEVRLNG